MFYIIINPTSGQGRARRIQHLIFDELEKRSIAYKTLAAEEAGQIQTYWDAGPGRFRQTDWLGG